MSRKTISLTLPPKRPPLRVIPSIESHQEKSEAPDRWVLHAEPDASKDAALPPKPGHAVIDLSVERSWFELVQLIWIFPYLATSCWMRNAVEAWLRSVKPR